MEYPVDSPRRVSTAPQNIDRNTSEPAITIATDHDQSDTYDTYRSYGCLGARRNNEVLHIATYERRSRRSH